MNIDQYIRLIWLHGVDWIGNTHLAYTLLTLIAIGSVMYSGMLRPRSCPLPRDGYVAAMVVGLTLVVGVTLLAVLPTSPLLSIYGGIVGSPWMRGLYPAVMLIMTLTGVVYGLASGVLSSWHDVVATLCEGFRRWPWMILVGMLW